MTTTLQQAETFRDVNGFEIRFDEVTYIIGNKICTRKTAFIGKPMYTVSDEVAQQLRAMFAEQSEAYWKDAECGGLF
jgi:hypothetical protein